MPKTFANAMTVDVEEYTQVSAFENILSDDDKSKLPSRVGYSTHKLLDLFYDKNIKATFFTLSSVAEKEKELVRRIVQEGHELASHGINHDRVRDLTPHQFFQDITSSKKTLEDIAGIQITGYRAPSFSIGADTPYAYDTLIEAGYLYSSSIHPIKHDHYGDENAPLYIHQPIKSINFHEFPITICRIFGKNFPIGGGGWFRLLPYPLYKRLLSIPASSGQPLMFYTHPWEYDPDQPRIQGLSWKTKFRHYINLDKNFVKLSKLCDAYHWTRCDNVINKYKLTR